MQIKKYIKVYTLPIILLLLVYSFNSYAQDFNADFLKIQEYNKGEKLKINFIMETKISDGIRDSVIKIEGESLRYKDLFYSKNNLNESVCNGDTLVVVDHINKLITLYNSSVLKQFQNFTVQNFSKDNFANDSVVYLGLNNHMKNYMIYFKAGDVSKLNLMIDSTGYLVQTSLYYPALEVGEAGVISSITDFTQYSTNIQKDDFVYRLNSYVINKKGQLSVSSKYPEYRLKNLMTK